MKRRTPDTATRHGNRRKGAIAVIVMIAVLITLSIGMQLVKTALISQRVMRQHQNQIQADWLVEAGIERAATRLEQSPEYEGETWELNAEELGVRDSGRVVITFEATPDNNDEVQLTVVADYPSEGDQRVRSRKVINLANTRSTNP